VAAIIAATSTDQADNRAASLRLAAAVAMEE